MRWIGVVGDVGGPGVGVFHGLGWPGMLVSQEWRAMDRVGRVMLLGQEWELARDRGGPGCWWARSGRAMDRGGRGMLLGQE